MDGNIRTGVQIRRKTKNGPYISVQNGSVYQEQISVFFSNKIRWKIDEPYGERLREPCARWKMKACLYRVRGGGGTPGAQGLLALKAAEGKTSYESTWKEKVATSIKNNNILKGSYRSGCRHKKHLGGYPLVDFVVVERLFRTGIRFCFWRGWRRWCWWWNYSRQRRFTRRRRRRRGRRRRSGGNQRAVAAADGAFLAIIDIMVDIVIALGVAQQAVSSLFTYT